MCNLFYTLINGDKTNWTLVWIMIVFKNWNLKVIALNSMESRLPFDNQYKLLETMYTMNIN